MNKLKDLLYFFTWSIFFVTTLFISACSTTEKNENDSTPKPLAVYTNSNMQQRVLKMWGNTSRDVLQASTFTAEERYFILMREVVGVIMTPPEKRNPCSTGIVISTKPVVPAPVNGSKSEIWVVDECSVRRAFQATLDAAQLAYIKKNPVLTEPVP